MSHKLITIFALCLLCLVGNARPTCGQENETQSDVKAKLIFGGSTRIQGLDEQGITLQNGWYISDYSEFLSSTELINVFRYNQPKIKPSYIALLQRDENNNLSLVKQVLKNASLVFVNAGYELCRAYISPDKKYIGLFGIKQVGFNVKEPAYESITSFFPFDGEDITTDRPILVMEDNKSPRNLWVEMKYQNMSFDIRQRLPNGNYLVAAKPSSATKYRNKYEVKFDFEKAKGTIVKQYVEGQMEFPIPEMYKLPGKYKDGLPFLPGYLSYSPDARQVIVTGRFGASTSYAAVLYNIGVEGPHNPQVVIHSKTPLTLFPGMESKSMTSFIKAYFSPDGKYVFFTFNGATREHKVYALYRNPQTGEIAGIPSTKP